MPFDPARTRWPALYTLCAGVLMIVLDATIVSSRSQTNLQEGAS